MPNKHSQAGHIPERTCVVCRHKGTQAEMLGFFIMPEGIVFDLGKAVMRRKAYLCRNPECYMNLGKWRKKYEKNIKRHAR